MSLLCKRQRIYCQRTDTKEDENEFWDYYETTHKIPKGYAYSQKEVLFIVLLLRYCTYLFCVCPRGVMVKVLAYGIVVSEFELI